MLSLEDVNDLVSSAYQHLYDFVFLRTHPLAKFCFPDAHLSNKERGWQLHNLLLDMVKELNPGPNAPPYSKEWRRHQLMVLRYVDGLELQQVADKLAISRRQYYREHAAAINAISQILWNFYRFDLSEANSQSLLQTEIERISHDDHRANIHKVIDGVLLVLQPALQERQTPVTLDLADPLPPVKISHSILRQVLLGLGGYIMEHIDQGRLELSARMLKSKLYLNIIADPALDLTRAQMQARIEPLEQILQAQGAHLKVLESGQKLLGFELTLPADRQAMVLVVDDNEDMLALYERYLLANHYQIVQAETAETAIILARRSQPTAVVLDLMMPNQDGWEVLKSLRTHPDTQHIPIVICSVLKQRELALALGAQIFLEKPISEAQLLASLASLENDHESPQKDR